MNKGLLNYKPGDKLRLHLEYAKTNESFTKRRRQFDRTGTFIEYINGNCKVKLDKPLVSSTGAKIFVVEVPVYYTLRFLKKYLVFYLHKFNFLSLKFYIKKEETVKLNSINH